MDGQHAISGSNVSFTYPLATSSPNKSPALKLVIDNIKRTVQAYISEEREKKNQFKEKLEQKISLMLAKNEDYFRQDYYIVTDENEENINPETSKKASSTVKENSRKIKSSSANKKKIIEGKPKQMKNNENNGSSSNIATRSKTRQMNVLTAPSTSAMASSNSRCATPLMSRKNYKIATVTPVKKNTSCPAIYRRPNPGEIAISLNGSPLMIASQGGPTNITHVNIPLKDGRIMSVLGTDGLDADFPDLDDSTIQQLQKLEKFLGQLSRKDKE
ncbi:hypothetical protein O3M35_010463 [Rhynocoris fuscipes]|uniref:Borealin C-terminal domain-containing protein n=1 Tax=Rhynocoris fuscipes TaxID=488301 RepID=A0AAW1CZ95_9HEMI